MTKSNIWSEQAGPTLDQRRQEGGFLALLPVGSTEAHGPHLPLNTDVIIAEGICHAAQSELREWADRLVVLPAITYTVTDCAAEFTGTVSVRPETVLQLLLDIGRSLRLQGAVGLCLANGHLEPNHRRVLRAACEQLEQEGLAAIFPDYVRRQYCDRLGDEFLSGACHAGEYETSLLLALRPELVRSELLAGLPSNPISLGQALKEGKDTFRAAGGPQAYFGDPAKASAEKGEEWLTQLAQILAGEVRQRLSTAT